MAAPRGMVRGGLFSWHVNSSTLNKHQVEKVVDALSKACEDTFAMTNPANTLRTMPNFDSRKNAANPVVRAHAGDRFTVVYRGVWAEFYGVWDSRKDGGKVRDHVGVTGIHQESQHFGALDFVCAMGYFVRACDFASEIQRGVKAKGKAFAGSTSWGSEPTRWEGTTGSDVTVTRKTVRGQTIRNSFKVGDRASYGSYNVTYYGTIVSISAKRIAVRERAGDKLHSMTHERFAGRNDHDFARTAEQDSHTRMTM